ncbi:MAG: hypothetical protein ACM3MH_02455 [Actinomycetota bacterium]
MDFSKIDKEMALAIIKSAEDYLAGQVSIATSADQRAAVMASVFAAAGAALVAGTITISTGNFAIPVIIGGALAGILFLAGAACCVRATMPAEFYLPGNKPHDWTTDCAQGRPLVECLGVQADHLQDRIEFNKRVIGKNAIWFRVGAWLGIIAPFVGALVWGLMTLGALTSALRASV